VGFFLRFNQAQCLKRKFTMDISHVKSLIMICLVLVPGYLFSRAKSKFVITEQPASWQEKTIYYVTHSMILFGLSISMFILSGADVVGLLTKQNTAQVASELLTWPWIVSLFVNPLLFGWIAAMGVRFDVVGNVFHLLSRIHGIKNLKPLPTLIDAWDSAFLALNCGKRMIVAVHMKNEAIIYGVFDENATANKKGSYTDLFLSRALSISEDGTLIPAHHSKGVFIRGSEIKVVYLFEIDAHGKLDTSVFPPSREEDSAHDQVTPRSTL
jgi:hypothetical protein